MDTFKLKLQNILLPHIFTTTIVVISYLILYYIFIITLEINIKDTLSNFVIPGAMSVIGGLIWVRPGVKRLQFKNDRLYSFYYMISMGFIFWTCVVAVSLLNIESYPLIHISGIKNIESNTKSIYYKIDRPTILNEMAFSSYTVTRSGKNNEYVNLNLYFVAPITDPGVGKMPLNMYKYWVCKKYSVTESSHLSEASLTRAFEAFAEQSEKDFLEKNYLNELNHFERLKHSDTKIQGMEAIGKVSQAKSSDIVLLAPSSDNLSKDALAYAKYILISLFAGVAVLIILLIYPKFDPKPLPSRIKKKDDLHVFLSFLIPKKEFFITPILLILNIAVFVILLFLDVDFASPTAQQLLEHGALSKERVLGGEAYRLITSMFVHAGFMHIVYNMFSLALSGFIAEPLFGRKKFFLLYLGGGIFSAFASMAINDGLSVGASGAIFGVFGALLIYAFLYDAKWILTLVGINAGISLFMGFITPGVDNVAHLAGLAFGIIFVLVIRSINADLINNTPKRFW